MRLEQISVSQIGRTSKSASYGVFAIILCAAFFHLALFCDFKEPSPFKPIALMLTAALAWQVFTLYHHRQLLSWILAILYAFGLLALAVQ